MIIVFELGSPEVNSARVTKLIKNNPKWARLTDSAFLITSNRSPAEVRDSIKVALMPGDKIFVGSSPAPSAWRGLSDEISKWIHANQKE